MDQKLERSKGDRYHRRHRPYRHDEHYCESKQSFKQQKNQSYWCLRTTLPKLYKVDENADGDAETAIYITIQRNMMMLEVMEDNSI